MTDENPTPTADPVQHVDPALWAEQAGTRAAADLDATLAGRVLADPFSTQYVDPLIIDDPSPAGEPSPAYRETVSDWWHQHQRSHPPAWSTHRGGNRIDAFSRTAVLERLDVDPWRVPSDGLLEYDPAHDEWRVELYRSHVWPEAGRIIVRKYAGRKRWARRRRGWVDLSGYIAEPGSRVWFRPGGPSQPDPPSMADLQGRPSAYAQLVERHRRPPYARGGRIPAKPVRDDQVDAMAYSVCSHYGQWPSGNMVALVAEMGTKLADAATPAGAVLADFAVNAEKVAAALRPHLQAMRERRDRA